MKNDKRIEKIQALIIKFNDAVDREQNAYLLSECEEKNRKVEERATVDQWKIHEKITEYPKTVILKACRASTIESVKTYYKNYIA